MSCAYLSQQLRDLAAVHGYAFFSAPEEYMPSEIDRYPARPDSKRSKAPDTAAEPMRCNSICCSPPCSFRMPDGPNSSI